MEEVICKAKREGLTIKIRHAKVVLCGASKAGKTSFSRLLRSLPFEKNYRSTGAGDSKQILLSSKVNIKGTDWKDLNMQEEMNELMKILLSRINLKSMHEISERQHASTPSKSYHNKQGVGKTTASSNEPVHVVSVEKRMATNIVALSDANLAFHNVPEVLDMLTLIDTGGQPEFINLIPAISASADFNFIVLNLSNGVECLDQAVVTQHSSEGYTKYEMNYTNCDLIKGLLSSIKDCTIRKCYSPGDVMIQEDQHPDPAVCFIGTCSDKIKSQIEHVIETVNKRILSDVGVDDTFFHTWSNNKKKIVFPVDNTTSGNVHSEDSNAHIIRCEFIKNILQKKALFEIPFTWFILELQLRNLQIDEKKACVSLEDVKKTSDQLMPDGKKMEMREIKEVLKFYHQLGVLLYFDSVDGMNKFVITDPQWLFCNLTEIVTCKFDDSKLLDKHLLDELYHKGILHEKLLNALELDTKDIALRSFLNLLEDLKIIVRYDQNSFYMPSILPLCHKIDEVLNKEDLYGKQVFYTDPSNCIIVEKLLITFKGNTIPRGLFNFLAIQMLQNNRPTFQLYGKSSDSQCYRYSNLTSFVINEDITHLLSIIDKTSYLEIHVTVKDDKTEKVYYDTQVAISKALKDVCKKIGWQFNDFCYGFLCPCYHSKNHKHLTLLSEIEKLTVNIAKCDYQQPTKLKDCHLVWFKVISY